MLTYGPVTGAGGGSFESSQNSSRGRFAENSDSSIRFGKRLGHPFGNGEDAHNSSSPGSMRNRTYTADVGPGDTLWIPAGWTHHVIALSPALSVSVTTPCPELDAMRALLVAHTELLLPRVLAHSEENGAAQRKAVKGATCS